MLRIFSLTLCLCAGCASVPDLPSVDSFPVPPPPDYAEQQHWAALPTTDDAADRTPSDTIPDGQATAKADVFFVHPTIYRDTREGNAYWNASLADAELNEAVDESTILNQASVFNAAGKVYAPRYRQANLSVFYDEGAAVKQRALDTAYTDVLAAFDHYLTHFNEGRPIILAAHSQGTLHTIRLLQDRFVGTALHPQLVAAYLVGMPVRKDEFADIPVCTEPTQTGCFVSWRTYREDYVPSAQRDDPAIAVVNPLSWTTSTDRAPIALNRGGVLYNYDGGIKPELVWAEIRGAFLYTNKPKFFGNIFFRSQNYHVADYNFFWMNVRENAVGRVGEF
ncbi:hypothetical protein LEM8419_00340 [Neolewinella maritima]|uniref:DUF3089 domain-containing protein n=1 Tax=Neolewinella maritima TaxID=1383882 RepID=A0ABM9AX14_9BACT|nr:DUF3089 domain-containing protein [Neolewinella maritima]CAH0999045.1 hypothetical protein LEM8419_00340 [Neolewinella maritima]